MAKVGLEGAVGPKGATGLVDGLSKGLCGQGPASAIECLDEGRLAFVGRYAVFEEPGELAKDLGQSEAGLGVGTLMALPAVE